MINIERVGSEWVLGNFGEKPCVGTNAGGAYSRAEKKGKGLKEKRHQKDTDCVRMVTCSEPANAVNPGGVNRRDRAATRRLEKRSAIKKTERRNIR